MGNTRKALPVKLVAGIIFKESSALAGAKSRLRREFGPIDLESQVMDFNLTDHYDAEMGTCLKKVFLSFERLILPQSLYKIKTTTNNIESRMSIKNRRIVNIDPGYIDAAKLVLASTKDYKHRIYLDKGIFAEITLSYQDNNFRPLDYTYPDYRTSQYIDIFKSIRTNYLNQIK